MHLGFLLYIFVHWGPPWLWGLVLKPHQSMLHFQAEPYMGWEGVKKPFSIPILQSRISTSSTSQEWQYLCHKLLVLHNSGQPRSWVTAAILFTLLRRKAGKSPASPGSWETAAKPLHGPFFTGLENWGEASLPNLWLLFPDKNHQNSWCGGNGESQDGFSLSFQVRTLPAVLVWEGRSCLSEECSPKWVPYSRMLIAVENIYQWAYLMKWFVDPKKLLYLIKSTAQEI